MSLIVKNAKIARKNVLQAVTNCFLIMKCSNITNYAKFSRKSLELEEKLNDLLRKMQG